MQIDDCSDPRGKLLEACDRLLNAAMVIGRYKAENATLTATVAALKRDMLWMLNLDVTSLMMRSKIRSALTSTTLGDDLLDERDCWKAAFDGCKLRIFDVEAKLRVATEALEDAKKALRPFAAISMPDVVQWLPDRYTNIEAQSGDIRSAVKCSAKIDAALAQIKRETK